MITCKAFTIISVTCILLKLSVQNVYGNDPIIAIVGAGASGIAAASKLLENGLNNIIILEAEHRIGGRVFTTKFGGYNVDMGGQWVHGEKGNVAYELAWPLGLLENSNKERYGFTFYDSAGNKPLAREQQDNITEFYFKVETSPEEFMEEGALESLGDVYRKAFTKYFQVRTDLAQYKSQMLNLFELIVNSYDSSMSWDDVFAGGEWEVEGDKLVNWKERGYSTILDILMKKYPDPSKELPVMDKIKLNTEVSKIDYTDTSGKVKIHTENGDIYEADHVIVTPSLGVLKATHNTLFEPSLSEEKKKFIQTYGFGSVAKIYLLFDHPWWETESFYAFGLNILWTDEDRIERENNPDKKWQLSIIGAIRVEHKPNLLCFWLAGEGAREMENIPEDKLVEQFKEILKIFEKDFNITEPLKLLRTQWYHNKHFQGTYSYHSMDAVKNHANLTEFVEPITSDNPKILFAGEATDAKSFSTVHGAIQSGWREADRLINLYSTKQDTR